MLRTSRLVSLLAVMMLGFAASAQTQSLPQGVRMVTSAEGITEYALTNGLHVLLFPDNSQPKVTVNITYMVGSRFEGYGETGMAHLLEHLNYIQTTTRSDIKKEIVEHAGQNMNGSTFYDRTNYWETMNASDENLKWALGLEADRMIHTKIEKDLLDKEMTVVRNEFESGENSPGDILFERVLETAYIWHSYGRPTIGSRADIEHVPIEKLAAFYHKYYQPDNAILIVAGKFDQAKALAWIADFFGKTPRPTRVLDQTYTVEPAQDGERDVVLRRVGDAQYLMVMYHMPAATHPDDAPLQVLAGVLGDTPGGRLYKALVDGKKAVGADMGTMELHDPGFMGASAQLSPDQSLEDAKKTMLATIASVVTEPPTAAEVERVKTRLLKNIELSMTNSQAIAIALTEYAGQGDWRMLFLERDRIKAVTPADVLRVAKLYLKDSNRTIGEFIPTKTPDRTEITAAPEISTLFKDFKGGAAVVEGEEFDPSTANIEKRLYRAKLPNGLKVVMLPKKNRGGTVFASMQARFGNEKTLFGKSAVADLTGAMLMRGTKSKSRQQIQDEIDRLKARLSVGAAANHATFSIQTVEANLPAVMKLAAEILKEPSFPDDEFVQVKKQAIAGIEEGRSDPQTLAFTESARKMNSMYPRGDLRYAPTIDEQIEDVQKVTLDDVKKFYHDFVGVSEGEMAVVGQFDKDAVEKLAKDLFGDWKTSMTYGRILTSYRAVPPANVKLETPDKENAVSLAQEMVKLTDEDPDYPALIMANYMLGGTISSRLSSRIRSKEGLSYGVQTNISAGTKDDGGNFLFFAISNPENAPKVEASFMDEMDRTIKGGFTADELAAAKKSWLEGRVVSRSNDGQLLGLLSSRVRWDRTMQFDQNLEDKVSALTPDQVNAALKKAVNLKDLVYVKAGDFKKAKVY